MLQIPLGAAALQVLRALALAQGTLVGSLLYIPKMTVCHVMQCAHVGIMYIYIHCIIDVQRYTLWCQNCG